MTTLQFEQALQRGQGRAALCLMKVDPAPYLPILIDACLHDRSFHISESSRTPYLLRLVELANVVEAVVDALLRELPTTEDERNDLPQRLDLLVTFAQRGHLRAKQALLGRALQQDEAVSALAALGVGALSAAHREEAQYDAEPETRALVL